MSLATFIGPLVCAAGIVAGPARDAKPMPVQRTAPVALVAAEAATSATEAAACDPCVECKPARRGLLARLGLRKNKCADDCVSVCPDGCFDPCAKCKAACRKPRCGMLARIGRFLFGSRKCCCNPCLCCCGGSVVCEVIKEEPKPAEPITEKVSYKPEVKREEPKPVMKPVRAIYGHADDYSWVQGRLEYVHVNGGAWIVRYAPLHVQDQYGGSVVLVRDARANDFREGDVVRVEGEILVDRPSVLLHGPLYRAKILTLVQAGPGHATK